MDNPINTKTYRRFGIEIELNTTTGIIKKWNIDERETPDGSDYVASLIHKATKEKVLINSWHHTHNNMCWIVKSDGSCGIEVCSPVLKGWRGQKKVLKVIELFQKSDLSAGKDCSFHVHINVGDLSLKQLSTVISYWIKCEHVFFDAFPEYRKNSRYCQFIGMKDDFKCNRTFNPEDIIPIVSDVKYYSLNAYHLQKGGGMRSGNKRRKTIEFRIADNNFCVDPWEAKNWIRLMLHFVECTKDLSFPKRYQKGNPWSSLLWLDPQDVFRVLRFDEKLSPGLEQVKDWFTNRLLRYGFNGSLEGIWSNNGREFARKELLEMAEESQKEIDPSDLYDEKYIL